ncbi:hypothetical protein KAS08_02295 [Candidatus Pacearchaeota archaeon]|nr:hypothetical protein [Candidatus Pacearchaeota archaeon]
MVNVNPTGVISGPAMAVLGGIVLVIAPWFSSINFFAKLLVSLIGIGLIFIGSKN